VAEAFGYTPLWMGQSNRVALRGGTGTTGAVGADFLMTAWVPEFNWRDVQETGMISTRISRSGRSIADFIGGLTVTAIQSMRLRNRCQDPQRPISWSPSGRKSCFHTRQPTAG
jgi:hypothetical protein